MRVGGEKADTGRGSRAGSASSKKMRNGKGVAVKPQLKKDAYVLGGKDKDALRTSSAAAAAGKAVAGKAVAHKAAVLASTAGARKKRGRPQESDNNEPVPSGLWSQAGVTQPGGEFH